MESCRNLNFNIGFSLHVQQKSEMCVPVNKLHKLKNQLGIHGMQLLLFDAKRLGPVTEILAVQQPLAEKS